MNRIVSFLCLLLWSGSFLLLPVQFPEDDFIKGWNRLDSRMVFNRSRLFNYIDGGAELFLEFGFQSLQVQRYGREKGEIAVEAYIMENPAAALGIYLLKCGPESPILTLPARNSGDRYQIAMVCGATYVVINNYGGSQDLLPVMGELASRVLDSLDPVPETESGAVLKLLPQTGQIPGTQRIIRGPYSLQSIFTFGEGDMLLLKGTILAAAADYRESDGSDYSRVMVRYPDEEYARAAFLHLQSRLDSHIRVLNRDLNRFVFVDFQKRYGCVERRKNLIDIGVRFVHNPANP